MKRFINWLTDCFKEMLATKSREEKISIVIGAVIGLLCCIFLYTLSDKVPATSSDYEPLEQLLLEIQENSYNTIVQNGNITISLENNECSLTAEFDEDFELLSISKEDKDMPGWYVFIASIVAGFFAFYGSCILVMLIINAIKYFRNKRKSIKSNS